MNKILIVAKREFLSRVQKKTFLLTTIGLPILIFGIYALIIFFAVKGSDNFKIAVADNANILGNEITQKNDSELEFIIVQATTTDTLKKQLAQEKINAYIYIPSTFNLTTAIDSIQIVAAKSVGLLTREKIERRLNSILDEKKLLSNLNVSKAALDSMQKPNKIVFTSAKGTEEKTDKAGLSYIIGFVAGFMIYIILFIYGTMVMRGVMEEKTNRIAEVIVSSVKPFQLMMGKIIGIGSVGLVQFLIWIVLVFGLQLFLPVIFPEMLQSTQPMQPGGMAVAAYKAAEESGGMAGIMQLLASVNWILIIGCFLFYFLGGYFLYASLFAAVGSTVNEDPQDAQSLMLPITMPIIFAMVIMTKAVNDPNSSIAVFGSIFPLTSPIVMMARIAHGVPDGVTWLQLIASMLCLVGGFLATTWLAAKIYRTGILMYGKKVTWKTLGKWIFIK